MPYREQTYRPANQRVEQRGKEGSGLLVAYNAAEESARAGRVGLWTDCDLVPPWVWRKARRE